METLKDDNSDFANNVYSNMMDLFFNPEIVKRREQGLLPNDFTLFAAQAIFFPNNRSHIVRLNEEVAAEVKLKKGVDATAKDFWASTYEVEDIKLYEKEFLDCGHSTLILFKDGFQLTFDFQYNKQSSLEHLQVAQEFLKTSKYSLDNLFLSSFIDNAFSTIELLAKINLLLEANKSVHGRTHGTLSSAFNLRYKNSQSDFEVERLQVYNKLLQVRTKVRYLRGANNLTELDVQSIYETINEMFNDLCSRVRFNNS